MLLARTVDRKSRRSRAHTRWMSIQEGCRLPVGVRAQYSRIRSRASLVGGGRLGEKARYRQPDWQTCAPKIRALIGCTSPL
jgi:hypothetical protein